MIQNNFVSILNKGHPLNALSNHTQMLDQGTVRWDGQYLMRSLLKCVFQKKLFLFKNQTFILKFYMLTLLPLKACLWPSYACWISVLYSLEFVLSRLASFICEAFAITLKKGSRCFILLFNNFISFLL